MRTESAVTRMSTDRVAMSSIVDRMTDPCENITFSLQSVISVNENHLGADCFDILH